MNQSVDVLIVGAGPAGLSAAVELGDREVSFLVVDDQPAPGGQIFRAVERADPSDTKRLGSAYSKGAGLVAAFRKSTSTAQYWPNSTLMNLTSDGQADILAEGGALLRVRAKAIVLATGAYERPVPVPGWTLPGVLTVGAAQIMAKQARMVPAGRTVIVGDGPLVWLLAWQYLNLEAKPVAILLPELCRRNVQLFRSAFEFLTTRYFRDGLKYLVGARRSGIEVIKTKAMRILGADRAEAVEAVLVSGQTRRWDAETVLLHDGILPNVQVSGAAGCDLVWSMKQQSWRPRTDEWGCTSRSGVFVVGDGAGIAGADAAVCSGRICAFEVLRSIGKMTMKERDDAARDWLQKRRTWLRGRAFIDALYPSADFAENASADTVVCRCESVPAQRIGDVLEACPERQAHLKFVTRCGMGPCQGRMCAASVVGLLQSRTGRQAYHMGSPSHRFPVKPLPLRALASFDVGLQSDPGTLRE